MENTNDPLEEALAEAFELVERDSSIDFANCTIEETEEGIVYLIGPKGERRAMLPKDVYNSILFWREE